MVLCNTYYLDFQYPERGLGLGDEFGISWWVCSDIGLCVLVCWNWHFSVLNCYCVKFLLSLIDAISLFVGLSQHPCVSDETVFVLQDLGLWQHLCSYFWLEYLCLHGLELPCCWQGSGLLSACHWSSTSILPQNRSVQPSLQVQIYCPNHFSLIHLWFPFWGYQSCLLYKIFELQVLK